MTTREGGNASIFAESRKEKHFTDEKTSPKFVIVYWMIIGYFVWQVDEVGFVVN